MEQGDQEKIIRTVENVFEGYMQNKELMDILDREYLALMLYETSRHSYILCPNGKVIHHHSDIFMVCSEENFDSNLREAAESYLSDFLPEGEQSPVEVMSTLERALGERVEVFKKDYAQNPQKTRDKIRNSGRNYI